MNLNKLNLEMKCNFLAVRILNIGTALEGEESLLKIHLLERFTFIYLLGNSLRKCIHLDDHF